MLVRERGNKKAICWPFVKPSNGLEPLTPPYHRATSREARAVPGSRGHESRARRRNLLRASDPAWTRVPGVVFPQCSPPTQSPAHESP
jgi:hypothetical protein